MSYEPRVEKRPLEKIPHFFGLAFKFSLFLSMVLLLSFSYFLISDYHKDLHYEHIEGIVRELKPHRKRYSISCRVIYTYIYNGNFYQDISPSNDLYWSLYKVGSPIPLRISPSGRTSPLEPKGTRLRFLISFIFIGLFLLFVACTTRIALRTSYLERIDNTISIHKRRFWMLFILTCGCVIWWGILMLTYVKDGLPKAAFSFLMMWFCLIIAYLLVCTPFFYFKAYKKAKLQQISKQDIIKNGQKIEAVVTQVEMKGAKSQRNERVHIMYKYDFGGKAYQNEFYWNTLINRVKVESGDILTIFVDKTYPDQSVWMYF